MKKSGLRYAWNSTLTTSINFVSQPNYSALLVLMLLACADSLSRSDVNRCYFTSPVWPSTTPPSKSLGAHYVKPCSPVRYPERMRCPTGHVWSATQGLHERGGHALTGSSVMNNPLRILRTLDGYLTQSVELTIFGRAALALGFEGSPAVFAATQDVDAILPVQWLSAPDENIDFWEAQQKTNVELESSGLYITHLFRELEIILTPDWLTKRVLVQIELQKLSVFRPSTLDLILTKMARGDENDLMDIRFLLQSERISTGELRSAFDRARAPEVPEIQESFKNAQPKVLEAAKALEKK